MDAEIAEAIRKVTNGKSLQVYLVNPPSENPTRTIGDYQEEQRESRQRHAMFIEQHVAIMRGQKWVIASFIVSAISAAAAIVMAWLLWQEQSSARSNVAEDAATKGTALPSLNQQKLDRGMQPASKPDTTAASQEQLQMQRR